jgi:prepilin-type N-terminal cleavage/methylation domain-containing protein
VTFLFWSGLTGVKRSLKATNGFSLIELLVVLAVMALLGALLLAALSRAKSKGQRTTCMSNLRQINLGVRMYSDDSNDAAPSPGAAAVTSTNLTPLYTSYKALMKHYVGLKGASSAQERLFACPADGFYPNWVFPDAVPPFHFVHKSIHEESSFDFSSYLFNGGDNSTRKLNTNSFTFPGLSGVRLSAVKHPSRTVLVMEFSAIAPWSWHEPSCHGLAHADGTLYNDSRNAVSFVDGHVSYLKMYWNTAGRGLSGNYNPPAGYDYQWSPD